MVAACVFAVEFVPVIHTSPSHMRAARARSRQPTQVLAARDQSFRQSKWLPRILLSWTQQRKLTT